MKHRRREPGSGLSSSRSNIPLREREVQVKWAWKIHRKRRSKKNLEGLYEVLAPGSNILKVSLTTSAIKEPGKSIVTVR